MGGLTRISLRTWTVLGSLVVVVIYFASIAAAGPWDPWETHYGEVARQILIRHDPLDLWWRPGNGGPDGNSEHTFWSKPALPYWMIALSFKLFGVGVSENPAELVQPLWPELALRLPSILAGLVTIAFLARVVWTLASPRAGLLTGLILATMPQWAMVTRQALTDMFFVGPVVVAMGAWALAWLRPDRALSSRGEGWKRIPWDRTYICFLLVFAVACLVPLAVLHAHVWDPYTITRVSRFAKRPGIPNLRTLQAIFEQLFVYWVIAGMVLVRSLRWRRRSQVWMAVFYVATGLSLLGKGIIGPGLVGALVLAHLVVTGRWDRLKHAGLPTGLALFALASFPWHHAMWLYRGERWVNELIVVNNLARFTTGEQKQAVGSVVFYLQTMGIAALPWVALLPLGLVAAFGAFRRRLEDVATAERTRWELQRFALLWFVVSLWALTYSVTKYYHYLLPVLPPLGVLVALTVDDVVAGRGPSRRNMLVLSGAGLVCVAVTVRDAIHEPAWIAHLTTYLYTGMWKKGAPEVDRIAFAVAPFAIGMILWTFNRVRFGAVAMVLSGLLTTAYVIDDYIPAASESWSQRSAMRLYFSERGPKDRLVSWWFYYRGETYFSRTDVWVMKEPSRDKLKELVDKMEGKGASLWFLTTVGHGKRLGSTLPYPYRDQLEEVYESFHYKMFRLRIP